MPTNRIKLGSKIDSIDDTTDNTSIILLVLLLRLANNFNPLEIWIVKSDHTRLIINNQFPHITNLNIHNNTNE